MLASKWHTVINTEPLQFYFKSSRYLLCVFLLAGTFRSWRENDTEWRRQHFHVSESVSEHSVCLLSWWSHLPALSAAFNESRGGRDAHEHGDTKRGKLNEDTEVCWDNLCLYRLQRRAATTSRSPPDSSVALGRQMGRYQWQRDPLKGSWAPEPDLQREERLAVFPCHAPGADGLIKAQPTGVFSSCHTLPSHTESFGRHWLLFFLVLPKWGCKRTWRIIVTSCWPPPEWPGHISPGRGHFLSKNKTSHWMHWNHHPSFTLSEVLAPPERKTLISLPPGGEMLHIHCESSRQPWRWQEERLARSFFFFLF